MKFDYESFIADIYEIFQSDISKEELKDLLSVSQEYELDDVHNKNLYIHRLRFTGRKSNGESFTFDKPFNKGVNLIVGGNLKGKSSVLKIIKFCLTGNYKSIRQDIYSWLDSIYLQFSVGEQTYTTSIDTRETSNKATLFSNTIDEIYDGGVEKQEVFKTSSNEHYTRKIESFFFSEFKFYNLQWTQKDSNKESIKMNTSNASWRTYYSTFNIESKDSNFMFIGNQEELSFQMMLGLKLTYPINRLKVKKELIEHTLAKKKEKHQGKKKIDREETKKVNLRIKQVETLIKKIKSGKKHKEDEVLIKQRKDIIKEILTIQSKIRKANNDINTLTRTVTKKRDKYTENKDFITGLDKKILQNNKSINKLKEYLEVGIFFTNIEVEICPHCNHKVEEENRRKELETRECMLCSHTPQEKLSDETLFTEKIDLLGIETKKIKKEISAFETLQKGITEEGKNLNKLIEEKELTIKKLKEAEKSTTNKFIEINKKMPELVISTDEDLIKLERELAVLKYKKEKLEKPEDNTVQEGIKKLNIEKTILSHSIQELKKLRLHNNQNTINNLQELILSEIKELGLRNVEGVKIGDNFKMKFKINGFFEEFSKISEGEKLRAKLALYLGLIQLNINKNTGKHPRFLVIDSPAKEEADDDYINGLIRIIEEANDRYEDKLQIIICTAIRKLSDLNISGEKYVYPIEEYLF